MTRACGERQIVEAPDWDEAVPQLESMYTEPVGFEGGRRARYKFMDLRRMSAEQRARHDVRRLHQYYNRLAAAVETAPSALF